MNAAVQDERLTKMPVPVEVTPMLMLQTAVSRGDDLARIEKLMELEDKWRAAQAKRAYVTAFSEFKKNAPDVVKDMLNKQYGSDYSSLANLVNTVNKSLGEYGLNARWEPDQSNGIKITCVLSHKDGHSESVSLSGPPDTSGQKNPLQQIKSTITYLEGATFQAVTGVVARSACADDDGNGAGKKPPEVTAPEGYENWRADMTALADEGTEKLQAAWTASKQDFRRHVVKHDELWWNATKKKATKVQPATVTQ